MTKSQRIILFILLTMLLGVTGLLAITLINTDEAASPVSTLAVLNTATMPPTRSALDTPSLDTVPSTWTPGPTRTPPPSSTSRATHTATPLPSITPTFAHTFTPRPTEVVTDSLIATLGLLNPGFEAVGGDLVPGWEWWAFDNFTPGGDYNPDSSFEPPLFKQADDPLRFIDGPTLQIDAVQHLKFRVHVFQTVPVSATARIGFQVMAGAFSDSGAVQLAAGIDPFGGPDCTQARWGDFVFTDQNGGVQTIIAPEVTAGDAGVVTVCLYAEPLFAAVSNAAFFDSAQLTVNP